MTLTFLGENLSLAAMFTAAATIAAVTLAAIEDRVRPRPTGHAR